MKNIVFLFLSLCLFLCLQLGSFGLRVSAPRILSTPMDGSVFHGERNVTPGYGQVVHEVWTPVKPWDYYSVRTGLRFAACVIFSSCVFAVRVAKFPEKHYAYTLDLTLDWTTGRKRLQGIPIKPSDDILARF